MDLLISGGTVVTMDAQRRVIEDGAVAIQGDSIVAVGQRTDLESQSNEARTIDASGTLVLPGLINGHAHAAMSLFRGIAEDHSLDDWLQRYIFPAEARNVTEDFVLWGTRLGLARNGARRCHYFRRHVLFRGRRRSRDQRGWDAWYPRGNHPRFSRARQ